MRIKDIVFGLIACSAFSFVSCSDDEFTEVQSSLTVTSAETSIEAAGGTKQIHVEGPLSSVYSSASWLTVAQNGSVVDVTAAVNPDVQSRNAIVVMKASANDSTIVNISQKGARVEINLPEQLTVLAHGRSEVTFSVLHNIPLNTIPSDSWISATITDDAIIICTEANTNGGNRSGSIEVSTGAVSYNINIMQYDVCGQYDLTGTDFSSPFAPVSLPGKIVGGTTGHELLFCPDKYNGEIQLPLTYDATTQSFSVSAASYCGMNNGLYVYTVLIAGNTQRYDPELTLSGGLEATADGQFKFALTDGSWNGTALTGFRLRTFTENTPVATAVKGTLENVKSPVFVRVSAN